MDLKLKGKIVLIAGATGDIGKAICRAFKNEGSRLAISSTSQEKLDALIAELDMPKEDLFGFVADLSKEEEVKNYINGAAGYFGTLDVIIPTAGFEGPNRMIQDCTMEDYMKVYSINVFGPMLVMKYAAPYLLKQGSGAIVTIASNGSYTTAPGMSAYCSSKHAVAGIAKTVALELGPHGIHCNYICPGAVDTDMMRRIEKKTFGDTKTHEEIEKIFADAYLDKRYCKPEEVADLAVFLASEVSAHIMGSGIRLDGGLDATC